MQAKSYSLVQIPATDYVVPSYNTQSMKSWSAGQLVGFVQSKLPVINQVEVDRWFAWYPVRDSITQGYVWLRRIKRYRPSNSATWYSSL